MSITSDIRAYADSALEQGRQVVGQAQHQLTDVTGQANEIVFGLTSKATGAVNDLRLQAEKTLNLDVVKSAVEPYLTQAKQYRSTVTDRAEGLFETVRGDKRVAKVVGTAEAVGGVVIDTVNDRIVKPVSALTGRGSKPAAKTPSRATKPATTRPAAKSTAKKAPAKKAPATKASSGTARKTPAKKSASKSTQS